MRILQDGAKKQANKQVVDVDPPVEARLAALEERVKQFVTFRQVLYAMLALVGLVFATLITLVAERLIGRVL